MSKEDKICNSHMDPVSPFPGISDLLTRTNPTPGASSTNVGNENAAVPVKSKKRKRPQIKKLTPCRRAIIMDFIEDVKLHPGKFGRPNSDGWLNELKRRLEVPLGGRGISMQDLTYWLENPQIEPYLRRFEINEEIIDTNAQFPDPVPISNNITQIKTSDVMSSFTFAFPSPSNSLDGSGTGANSGKNDEASSHSLLSNSSYHSLQLTHDTLDSGYLPWHQQNNEEQATAVTLRPIDDKTVVMELPRMESPPSLIVHSNGWKVTIVPRIEEQNEDHDPIDNTD